MFRYSTPKGEFEYDKITLDGEPANAGVPLLIEVMRGGRRVSPPEPIAALRERCLAGLAHLPQRYRQISRAAAYPVHYTKRLETLLENVRRRIRRSALK